MVVSKAAITVFSGAVLSLVPAAFCSKQASFIIFPGTWQLIADCAFLLFSIVERRRQIDSWRILLALFPIFGTWVWCNLDRRRLANSLGFALLGEAAAPIALSWLRPFRGILRTGFGNRTDCFTLPVYAYLLLPRRVSGNPAGFKQTKQWFHVLGSLIRFPDRAGYA
jgi:hypothetical protein